MRLQSEISPLYMSEGQLRGGMQARLDGRSLASGSPGSTTRHSLSTPLHAFITFKQWDERTREEGEHVRERPPHPEGHVELTDREGYEQPAHEAAEPAGHCTP